ncbi:MAG: hypothetical protein ACOYN0_03070 [Phycisphaerales bacterium]
MSPRYSRIGLCALPAALLFACEDKSPQPPLTAPQVAPAQPASAPVNAPQKPAPVPDAAPAPAVAAVPSGATLAALGMEFPLPAGWNSRPPSNNMRLAEAEVPGPGGDASKGCLVVFSTAGGTVDDNITRWSGQVRDAQGQPAKATRSSRAIAGIDVTVVEMSGSYAGMGDSAAKDNYMLRGAIIPTAGGLLFIKMTGPAEQMTAAAAAFDSMLGGLKKP